MTKNPTPPVFFKKTGLSFLSLVLFLSLSGGAFGQTTLPGKDTISKKEVKSSHSKPVYEYVEQMPEYPGGLNALMHYLRQNVKYPGKAKRKNIQGTVIVRFVIGKSGAIENVRTVGKKLGGGLEKEAMRVVKRMPRWKPGIQKGKKVRVQYNLPIRFQLTDNKKKKK